jgi:hypothetical protein
MRVIMPLRQFVWARQDSSDHERPASGGCFRPAAGQLCNQGPQGPHARPIRRFFSQFSGVFRADHFVAGRQPIVGPCRDLKIAPHEVAKPAVGQICPQRAQRPLATAIQLLFRESFGFFECVTRPPVIGPLVGTCRDLGIRSPSSTT